MWVVMIKDITADRGPSNGIIGKLVEEKLGGN